MRERRFIKFLYVIVVLFSSISCRQSTGIKGNQNNDNTIIQGDNNTIDQSQNIINMSEIKVKELYPDIVLDYDGASKDRILQDFGQPNSKGNFVETLGPDYEPEEPEKYITYFYGFKNGYIEFYIDKQTLRVGATQVGIKDDFTKVKVPVLSEIIGPYPLIILGKSKFKDLFELGKPDEVFTNWGTAPGSTYSECEFYFGNYGGYRYYHFGITGYGGSEVNDDYTVMKDLTPNYLIIY